MLTTLVPLLDFNDEVIKVPLFQLLQWVSAMKLEDKGMKMSRGRSVTHHVRLKLKSTPRYNRQLLIDYLQAVLDDVDRQIAEHKANAITGKAKVKA